MVRLALALAASLALGCSSGTAVLLTLTGNATGVDEIAVYPSYDGVAGPVVRAQAAEGAARALPATIAVEVPDRAATVTLAVVVSAGGQPLLRGVTDAIAVAPHQTARASLALGFCGGPSSCAGATCASFDAAVAPPFYPRALGGGTVAVDATHVCRGAGALHLVTEPFPADTNVYATTFEQALVPSASAPLYVRAFFFVPPSGLPANLAPIEAYQSQAPFCGVGLHLAPDGSYYTSDFCGASGVESARVPAFPTGRWVCVEQEIAAAAGQVRTWIDDVAVPALDLDGVATLPSPPLDSLNVGIIGSSAQAAPPAELWLDEVMVATQRIGCAP